MPISSDDIMRAILSMDTYHRSYNWGVRVGDPQGSGAVQLGYWVASDNSHIGMSFGGQSDEEIGFFAQAYTRGSGEAAETVIAYRGTDNRFVALDTLTGYPVGVGHYDVSQAYAAIQFYQHIAGGPVQGSDSTTLTGQSLGGGLAGYVARLYGLDAIVFDHMAFELAAQRAATDSVPHEVGTDEFGNPIIEPPDLALKEKIYGAANPWQTSATGITAYALEGEILTYLQRPDAPSYETRLDPYGNLARPDAPDYFPWYMDDWPVGLQEAGERHSSAPLIITMFGTMLLEDSESSNDSWTAYMPSVWHALSDVGIAGSVGLVAGTHYRNTGDSPWASHWAMQVMIAYSAIDEGERPFGDTAIRAMFDDANDLGRLYGDEAAVSTYREYFQGDEFKQHLADMLVQYAGAMAFSHDETTWKRDGVIKTDATQEWLRLDLTDERWMLDPEFTGGNLFVSEIVGRAEVVGYLLAGAGVALPPDVIVAPPYSFWHDKVSPAFGREVRLDHVKVVQAALTESADTDLDLISDADSVSQQAAFSLAVGNDGDNEIRGGYGDNILIGAKGDDTFYVETTPETPLPPLLPGSGDPPTRPTVMILGGEGHDIVDHSGQEERLTLSLDSVEEGSVKLVVATDAGKQIGESLDLVEELWLTNFGDAVTGALTDEGRVALAEQPLLVSGGTAGEGSTGDATLADRLDFTTSERAIVIGADRSIEDVTTAELYTGYDPVSSVARFVLNMLIPTGSTTGGGLTGATGLAFTDFEHVIGSAHDDVLALKDLAPGGALSAADRAMIEALLATLAIGLAMGLPGWLLALHAAIVSAVAAFVLSRPESPREEA